MNINKITAIILLGIGFATVSCEKWLDVNPASQVKADELFKTESGFREALYGIYTTMSSDELYGGNLTMSFLDVLAQNYVITMEGRPFYQESKYEYRFAEGRINAIWAKQYFCIANCNNLLENLKGKEGIFLNDNYRFFLAETKALRAFLHFDLLRMYAPSVASGGDKPAIPYVDKLSKTAFPQLTVNEIIEKVIDELNEAQDLLREVDPIGPSFNEYEDETDVPVWQQTPEASFLFNRKNRMNYYAITGLLARVYRYKGDTSNALNAAKDVIESNKFMFVLEEDIDVDVDVPDIIFKNEILFGLYNDNLKAKSDNFFKEKALAELSITEQRKSAFYESGAEGMIDYRGRMHFGRNSNELNEYVVKYNKVKSFKASTIPLIRLSEMYYIAIECAGDNATALNYFNTIRKHRGYHQLPDETILDVDAELYKEYRKEFIAEGQMFYYLKRKNITEIEYTNITGSDKVYVLPIPDNEIEFGDIIN